MGHHLRAEHRGEDAVVAKDDGSGHLAPQEHLWELDEGETVLLGDIRRFLDRDVRQRAVASNFAGELLRLGIRTIAHDGVQGCGIRRNRAWVEVHRDVPVLVRRDVERRGVHLDGELAAVAPPVLLLGREGEVDRARNFLWVGDSEVGLDAAGREFGQRLAVFVEHGLSLGLGLFIAGQVGQNGPKREHLARGVERVRLQHGGIQANHELVLLEDAAEILRGDARYDALPSDGVDDTQGLIRRISAADVHAAQLAERPVILSLEHNLDRGLLARFDRARGRFQDERAELQLAALSLGRRQRVPVLVLLELRVGRSTRAVVEEVIVKGEVSHVGNLKDPGLGLRVVHRGPEIHAARRRERVLGVGRPDGNLDRDLIVSNPRGVNNGQVQVAVVHQVHLAFDLALAGHPFLDLNGLVEVELDRDLGAGFDFALRGFDGE